MTVFVAGVAVTAASLSPWVDEAADRSLTGHVVQHLVLTMVAAPLLVLGGGVVLRRLPRRLARALVLAATPVVGFVAYVAAHAGVHFTGFYDYASEHALAHAAEHAILLGSALLLWAPVLMQLRPLLLAAAMPVSSVIGVVLLMDDHVRYEHYSSLADQHRAGALLWVAGSLLMVVAIVAAAWRRLRREERRALAREAYGR